MKPDGRESRAQNAEIARKPTWQLGAVDESDRSQIIERLHWPPQDRLRYLVDMLAFEERARRARRVQ